MWPAQFGRKLVFGTRRKWPRLRRDRDETETLTIFLETRPRLWYVSRPSRDQDVETETTTLRLMHNGQSWNCLLSISGIDAEIWDQLDGFCQKWRDCQSLDSGISEWLWKKVPSSIWSHCAPPTLCLSLCVMCCQSWRSTGTSHDAVQWVVHLLPGYTRSPLWHWLILCRGLKSGDGSIRLASSRNGRNAKRLIMAMNDEWHTTVKCH